MSSLKPNLPSGTLTPQETSELHTFKKFAPAAIAAGVNIDLGTVQNRKPDFPDISCEVNGVEHFYELGEITDEELAEETSVYSKRKQDGPGGAFSELMPLVRILKKKTKKKYKTDGASVDLVLHYDTQYPFAPAEYLKNYESEIVQALVPQGPFSRIWIFDGWNDTILWDRKP